MNDGSADCKEEIVLRFSEIQEASWKQKNIFKTLEILDITNVTSKKEADYHE